MENNTNSGHPYVQSHPMIASNISKLFPSVIEEENPDCGEWDTDVMKGHPVVHTAHELYYCWSRPAVKSLEIYESRRLDDWSSFTVIMV